MPLIGVRRAAKARRVGHAIVGHVDKELGRRRSIRLGPLRAVDEAEAATRNRKAQLAAGAALALALDGAIFGWALDNLRGSVAWAALSVSAATVVAATASVGIAVSRLDRKLAKVRRVRRLLDLVT